MEREPRHLSLPTDSPLLGGPGACRWPAMPRNHAPSPRNSGGCDGSEGGERGKQARPPRPVGFVKGRTRNEVGIHSLSRPGQTTPSLTVPGDGRSSLPPGLLSPGVRAQCNN